MDQRWTAWTRQIADELGAFEEHEFANLSGPTETEERPPGLFGRKRKPRVLSAPVVRLLRTEDHLLCETVNPFPAPDEPQLSDEQRQQLHEAGWLMSGDADYEPMGGPYCRIYVPIGDATRAAELAAVTFGILGVQDPAAVEVERDR
ncbi:MAG: TY-Chap domain-containing protein [Marmoricola sp.]